MYCDIIIHQSCTMIRTSCTPRRPTVASSPSLKAIRPSSITAMSEHSENSSKLVKNGKLSFQNNYKVNLPGAIVAACLVSISPAPAQGLLSEQTFSATCAGCHAGGGNIVKREATLTLSDLSKYGFDSPETLFDIIYFGKGSMPGYGEKCQPRGQCTFGKRLTDDEIRNLAAYVIENAKEGWKD